MDNQIIATESGVTQYFAMNREQMLDRFAGDEKKLNIFKNSIIEQVTNNKALASCSVDSIVRECYKAANMGLSLCRAMNHAYLVPYAGQPQLIIGWRGYVALALSTGRYRTLNAGVIHRGELENYNPLTGEVKFSGKFYPSEPIVGYFCYFEIENKETGVVYRHSLIMGVNDMINHAKAYVKTLRNTSSEQLYQASQNSNGTGIGWIQNFTAMAVKTIVKQNLTKWGVLSSELESLIQSDREPQDIVEGAKSSAGSEEIREEEFMDIDNNDNQ